MQELAAQQLTLQDVSYAGKPCTHATVTVQLPGSRIWSVEDVCVKAGIDSVHVRAHACAPLAVKLNIFIKQRGCECSVSGAVLTITAPLCLVQDVIAAAQAAKPLPMGSLHLQSTHIVSELD